MGCGPSSQPQPRGNAGDNEGRQTLETVPPKNENKQDPKPVKDESFSKEHGENEDIVNIHDDVQEKEKSREEPKLHIEETDDIGDCKLGITDDGRVAELYASLRDGELFCDEDFPADNSSLSYSDHHEHGITWVRPKIHQYSFLSTKMAKFSVPQAKCPPRDLVEEPYVQKEGMTRHDIQQGALGDCWFLSSCAAISVHEPFMKRIIPSGQVLFGPDYKGIIHVRFWRFGAWTDVYIDDRLPVKYNKLLYANCTDPSEFWVALMEKAYAKLHGSYEAIEGGQTVDSLVDLTGGLAERHMLDKDVDQKMFRTLLRAYRAGSYFTCSIKGGANTNHADSNGLVSGHAYTITKIVSVLSRSGRERLLRIRNPWGDATEWKGAFSDGSSAWGNLDAATKARMEVENQPDGEFWMRFFDFCQHFQEVSICTVGPDFDGDGITDQAGQVAMIQGSWVPGHNAGGCRNDMDMFVTNPQFQITITQPDVFDPETDDAECEGHCSVVIALMQEHRRSQRHLGLKTLQIGFLIYKNDNPDVPLPSRHFRYNYETGSSGSYINLREVSARFELEPGSYVIVPTTFDTNQAGTFLIRVFTQNQLMLKELSAFSAR